MDLREALYISSIRNYNGISNAAKHLDISQSTLSRCLQAIEDKIGEPLFIRCNGQYSTTYIGEQYLNYANKLLEIENDWNHSLKKHQNPEYGSVVLSVDSMYLNLILPHVLSEFRHAYPCINLEILDQSAILDTKGDSSTNSTSDLSISITDSHKLSNSDILLGYDEILLCAPYNNKIKTNSFSVEGCQLPSIELEQILDSRIISYGKQSYIALYMESYFDKLHISPAVSISTPDYLSAVTLLKNNLGLCFLPHSIAKGYSTKKEIDMYHFQNKRESYAVVAQIDSKLQQPEYLIFLLELIKDVCKTIF